MKLFRAYVTGGRWVLVVSVSTSAAKKFLKTTLGLSASRLIEIDTTCMSVIGFTEVTE